MAIFSDISILRILVDIFPENSKLTDDLVTLWDGDGYKILHCAYHLSTDIDFSDGNAQVWLAKHVLKRFILCV